MSPLRPSLTSEASIRRGCCPARKTDRAIIWQGTVVRGGRDASPIFFDFPALIAAQRPQHAIRIAPSATIWAGMRLEQRSAPPPTSRLALTVLPGHVRVAFANRKAMRGLPCVSRRLPSAARTSDRLERIARKHPEACSGLGEITLGPIHFWALY